METLAKILLETLRAHPSMPRLWLAYSGGGDSQALLYALAHAAKTEDLPPIHALHVHHGLHPEADAWAEMCAAHCARVKIPLSVARVTVTEEGKGLEAAARAARYQVFRQRIGPGEGMFTAHHQDDQAETLLLQLLRGAGPAGLAAMPVRAALGQGWLLRPFLSLRRRRLREALAGLDWVEDPANQNPRFARNAIRHRVLPTLETLRVGAVPTLARAARHQAESLELLAELAELDYARVQNSDHTLAVSRLRDLSPPRQRNLARWWLRQAGLPMPPEARLREALDQMLAATPDATPQVTWDGGWLTRYRDSLYALPPLPTPAPNWRAAWPGEKKHSPRLILGQLTVIQAHQGPRIALAWAEQAWELGLRQGGEVCVQGGHRHALKKRLQQAGIPVWIRPYWPLVWIHNRLAAIPGVGVCDDFAARGTDAGWGLRFDWKIGQAT